MLEAGLTIASITYGSMLGVFLLGVLTKKANEKGSILGMAVGLASMLSDLVFQHDRIHVVRADRHGNHLHNGLCGKPVFQPAAICRQLNMTPLQDEAS